MPGLPWLYDSPRFQTGRPFEWQNAGAEKAPRDADQLIPSTPLSVFLHLRVSNKFVGSSCSHSLWSLQWIKQSLVFFDGVTVCHPGNVIADCAFKTALFDVALRGGGQH